MPKEKKNTLSDAIEVLSPLKGVIMGEYKFYAMATKVESKANRKGEVEINLNLLSHKVDVLDIGKNVPDSVYEVTIKKVGEL